MNVEISFLDFDSILLGFHLMNYDSMSCDGTEVGPSGPCLMIGLIFFTVNIYF